MPASLEVKHPTPTCPECGRAASQSTVRDIAEHIHEGTYVCPLEHLWTTKWFAVGARG